MQTEMEEAGSHHGDPTLLQRDVKLLADFELWVQTARKARPNHYKPDWLPSHIDMLKSRLFWRIRSGKPPLEHAPPCAYSCPWYELIEDLTAHDCFEPINGLQTYTVGAMYRALEDGAEGQQAISFAQDIYRVVRQESEDRWLVAFGPYRFWAWNGPVKWNTKDGERERKGGWIQRAPDEESSTSAKEKDHG